MRVDRRRHPRVPSWAVAWTSLSLVRDLDMIDMTSRRNVSCRVADMRTLSDRTAELRLVNDARAYADYLVTLALRRPLESLPSTHHHERIKAAVSLTDDAALRNQSHEFLRVVERPTILGQLRDVV